MHEISDLVPTDHSLLAKSDVLEGYRLALRMYVGFQLRLVVFHYLRSDWIIAHTRVSSSLVVSGAELSSLSPRRT